MVTRWLQAQPRWVWFVVALLWTASVFGASILTSVLLGNGPVRGLQRGVVWLVVMSLFLGFVAYRVRTAHGRQRRRRHSPVAYEAAHRGDDRQEGS